MTRRSGVYLEVSLRNAGLLTPHSFHTWMSSQRRIDSWKSQGVLKTSPSQLSWKLFLTETVDVHFTEQTNRGYDCGHGFSRSKYEAIQVAYYYIQVRSSSSIIQLRRSLTSKLFPSAVQMKFHQLKRIRSYCVASLVFRSENAVALFAQWISWDCLENDIYFFLLFSFFLIFRVGKMLFSRRVLYLG